MRISNMKTAIRKAENDYLFGGKGEGGIMFSTVLRLGDMRGNTQMT